MENILFLNETNGFSDRRLQTLKKYCFTVQIVLSNFLLNHCMKLDKIELYYIFSVLSKGVETIR